MAPQTIHHIRVLVERGFCVEIQREMAKGKKGKKKQGRKKRTAKRGAMVPTGMATSGHSVMALAMQACSIYNPFCPEAKGAKFPDESYVKTVTWDIQGFPYVPVVSAAGQAGVWFCGDINQVAVGTVGTFPSYAATTLNPLQIWPSDIGSYRVTSWGLRLRCTGSKMSQTGMVRVRLYSPIGGTSLTSWTSTTTYCDDMYDVPLSSLIDRDLWIIPKPLGTNARLFRDVNAAGTAIVNWVNPGWQVVAIGIDGAPASSSTLEIASFYHYEGMVVDGGASAAFATAPPRNNPTVVAAGASALESAGSFIEGAATRIDKFFKSNTFKYLAAAVGGAYGGPAGASMALGGASAYKSIRDVD